MSLMQKHTSLNVLVPVSRGLDGKRALLMFVVSVLHVRAEVCMAAIG